MFIPVFGAFFVFCSWCGFPERKWSISQCCPGILNFLTWNSCQLQSRHHKQQNEQSVRAGARRKRLKTGTTQLVWKKMSKTPINLWEKCQLLTFGKTNVRRKQGKRERKLLDHYDWISQIPRPSKYLEGLTEYVRCKNVRNKSKSCNDSVRSAPLRVSGCLVWARQKNAGKTPGISQTLKTFYFQKKTLFTLNLFLGTESFCCFVWQFLDVKMFVMVERCLWGSHNACQDIGTNNLEIERNGVLWDSSNQLLHDKFVPCECYLSPSSRSPSTGPPGPRTPVLLGLFEPCCSALPPNFSKILLPPPHWKQEAGQRRRFHLTHWQQSHISEWLTQVKNVSQSRENLDLDTVAYTARRREEQRLECREDGECRHWNDWIIRECLFIYVEHNNKLERGLWGHDVWFVTEVIYQLCVVPDSSSLTFSSSHHGWHCTLPAHTQNTLYKTGRACRSSKDNRHREQRAHRPIRFAPVPSPGPDWPSHNACKPIRAWVLKISVPQQGHILVLQNLVLSMISFWV